jgi:pantoate--beta-alanine ligase
VVAKLFNIVRPTMAVFGAKDWQQATIIRRMVRNLNFPTRVIVATTVRESDGLAMSSRNKYLAGDLRRQATVLIESIRLVRSLLRRKVEGIPAARLRSRVAARVRAQPNAALDYVAFFRPDTLSPVSRVRRGDRMALAVRVGTTRLIDNALL